MPLVASQVIGLILARYVVRIEPIASLDTERLVAIYAPTIQRYLTGDAARAVTRPARVLASGQRSA